MVKHVFCIKDELVGFLDPVFEFNSDLAIRKFKYSIFKMITDEDSGLGPVEDFNLYEIGSFNLSNGEFISCSPKQIYTGARCLKEFNSMKHSDFKEASE